MSYSNLMTTYLGSGAVASRPATPNVPGCAIWWDYNTGTMYLYGNGAWTTLPDNSQELSYSADHVVLAAEASSLLYMDASGGNRNFVIPRTLSAPFLRLARDPGDTTGNIILIYDCVSPSNTAPVNVIDVIDAPNNLGKIQSKTIRVNGTRVVSL